MMQILRPWNRTVPLLSMALLLLLVTACAAPAQPAATGDTPADTAEETSAEEAPAASGEPQSGGTLTIAEYSEPDILDPHISFNRHTWLVALQMFDTLLVASKEGELLPHLATSWEVNEDGTSYTFTLREDVTFHDGEPFNAEAVKYNFDRIVDPDTGSLGLASDLGPYESSEVLDEYTVQINFSEPNGSFPLLAATRIFMVSPAAAEAAGPDDFGFQPVGSGPFQFVEWIQQDSITLERYDEYDWAPEIFDHDGVAYLDQVIFRYIIEPGTRLAALEAGEVDVAIRLPEYDVARIREDERFSVLSEMVPGLPTNFIMNTNQSPLDDVRVRRALNLWLDRELVNDIVWAGENAPAYGPITPNTFAYLPAVEEINALDREQAQALLAEAGWEDSDGDGILDKDGEPLTLQIYSGGDYTDPPEAISGQFVEMGADVEIVMVPWAEQRQVASAGDHHLMVATFNNPDPRVMRLLFHSENVGESGWVWTHLTESDPDLQAQIDELLVAGDQESDQAAREEIYQEVQRLLVDNAVTLPVRIDFYIYGMTPAVQGWMTTVTGWPLTYNIWLSE